MLKDRRFVENLNDALQILHCTNPCALLPPSNTEKGHQVDIFKIPIQKKDIKWTTPLTRPRMQQNIEFEL